MKYLVEIDTKNTRLLRAIHTQLGEIMKTQAEVAAELGRLTEQVTKTKAELQAKLDELSAAIIAAGNATPEVEAALAALGEVIQSQDDVVPDAE